MGLEFYVGPELEYFYFKDAEHSRGRRRGRLLRRAARRPRQRPAQADHAHPGQARHPHGGQPPRGRPVAARDRPALRQGAHHGRPRHGRAPHRQGGRRPQRRARHLHAQAHARRERQRHARAPVALPRHVQRHVQRDGPRPPERPRQELHRRPAQAHARVHVDPQPVREQLQAPGARLRGPRVRQLGAPQPHRPHPRAAVRAGQGEHRARRAAQPGPGRQPVPGVRRHARAPASRASRRATSCRRRSSPTSTR